MTSFRRGALAVLLGLGMAGCEWQGGGGGDGASSNTSAGYANFSGTYREPGGGFVVSLSVSSTTTNYVNSVQQIGTGNAVDKHFEATLSHKPVLKGSVNVIAALGSVSLSDPTGGSGNLTGTGGSGAINYDTGFVSVNCTVAPGAGTPVRVSYSYPDSFASGEDSGITKLNVQQDGNSIRIVDSNGKTYTGTLGSSRTGSGAAITAAAVGDTVASQFEAGGQSASGRNVRMVGTFSATVSGAAPNVVLSNRRVAGTWIEDGGTSAGISASAD